ncbi:MAG TPA: M28 family peptidase, partial [Vicinamibacterales bacterium]
MNVSRRVALAVTLAAAAVLPLGAQWPATERNDLDAIYRIKDEGLQRSKVMEIESYLTDVYGPRLTGSPNIREAAEWTQKTMKDWGLTGVHLETWPFGRGWQNQRMVAMAMTPRAFPLIAYPKAWTPGTNGPVTGEAVIAVIENEHDFDTFKGKLRGKFVLASAMREVPAHFDAPGHRYSDSELVELSHQPPAGRGRGRGNFNQDFNRQRTQFWIDEGVAAVLDTSRGDGGTVFVQAPQGVSRDPKGPPQPTQATLAIEHYGRIWRLLEKKIPVTLSMDIDNRFYDQDQNAFNIVGELTGADKADEIVMLGAHFDSWHTGTGATDNAAGSAVMMEVVRILKA